MDDYIFHKTYNTYYEDLTPMIMTNALSINVSLLTYTGSAYITRFVQSVFQQPCITVTVYKSNDHYDAIVPIYSMNQSVPRRQGQLVHGKSMPVSNETTNMKTDGMGSIISNESIEYNNTDGVLSVTSKHASIDDSNIEDNVSENIVGILYLLWKLKALITKVLWIHLRINCSKLWKHSDQIVCRPLSFLI